MIRRLVPADAPALQALRLFALRDCPSAFSSSYEEESGMPLATVEGWLAPDSGRIVFGAFESALAGMVVLGRESAAKLRHKAAIRGMYVAPEHRGKGFGRQLMAAAMASAGAMEGVRQINLIVTAGNDAAYALYRSLGFNEYGREPGALMVNSKLYDDIYMVCHVK